MTIEIKGLDELLAKFHTLEAKMASDIVKQAVEVGAERCAELMRERAPKRTGALAGSVQVKVKASGNTVEAEIGPADHKAKWMEKGINKPRMRRASFPGKRPARGAPKTVSTGTVSPRPFMEPSVFDQVVEHEISAEWIRGVESI